MLISGKMATIGVTWRITANGKNDISTHRDWANSTARPTPPATASARLRKVILSVTQSEEKSSARSLHSVAITTWGRGRMYCGISFHTQSRSHSQTASTMMNTGSRMRPSRSSRAVLTRRASSASSAGRAPCASSVTAAASRPGVHRLGEHAGNLAAERRIVGRGAEGIVARIRRGDGELANAPAPDGRP